MPSRACPCASGKRHGFLQRAEEAFALERTVIKSGPGFLDASKKASSIRFVEGSKPFAAEVNRRPYRLVLDAEAADDIRIGQALRRPTVLLRRTQQVLPSRLEGTVPLLLEPVDLILQEAEQLSALRFPKRRDRSFVEGEQFCSARIPGLGQRSNGPSARYSVPSSRCPGWMACRLPLPTWRSVVEDAPSDGGCSTATSSSGNGSCASWFVIDRFVPDISSMIFSSMLQTDSPESNHRIRMETA